MFRLFFQDQSRASFGMDVGRRDEFPVELELVGDPLGQVVPEIQFGSRPSEISFCCSSASA
jgi:hypothetical protein